jgi:hypothetical protein
MFNVHVGGKEKSSLIPSAPITPSTPKIGFRDSIGSPSQSQSQSITGRNFFNILLNAMAQPPSRPWSSKQQYHSYMELILSNAMNSFMDLGLCYLAERCTFSLIDIYRQTGQIDEIANKYSSLATSFKSIVETGNTNSSFGMGTFYWVQYIGKGTI